MASIALRGRQNLAPEVVPGASLHSEALSRECGREHQETGDCGPTQHVGAGLWGLLGPRRSHLVGLRLGFEVSRFPLFWRGAWHVLGFLGVEFGAF